ncbi:MAG: cupredoxin domain-containing protein, partial [Patescibacteria group bacterium]
HIIKWNNATGYTIGLIGGIYLVNAQTKEIAGWIVSGLNHNQTSQLWDTRSVFLSKNSPVKKDIQTGSYIIKVALDNKGVEGQSAPFQVLYKEQIQAPVHNVTIKDFKFSPEKLTVRKGDKIVFTNADNVTHSISNLGQSIKLLSPGESYELSTNIFSAGQYNLYSEKYSSAKLSLIVN